MPPSAAIAFGILEGSRTVMDSFNATVLYLGADIASLRYVEFALNLFSVRSKRVCTSMVSLEELVALRNIKRDKEWRIGLLWCGDGE